MDETLPEKLERHQRELIIKLQKAQQSGYEKAEKILISEFLKDLQEIPQFKHIAMEFIAEIIIKWEARLEP